jgi:predicted nucleotidyltransferase
MFTRNALIQHISAFLAEIQNAGYAPSRVVLFGSYAKGKPHQWSDVDLAIWDEHFVGVGMVDIVPILPIISKYRGIELHPFPANETEDENPFIGEVVQHGIDLTWLLTQAAI